MEIPTQLTTSALYRAESTAMISCLCRWLSSLQVVSLAVCTWSKSKCNIMNSCGTNRNNTRKWESSDTYVHIFYMHTNIVTNLHDTFQCKNRKYNIWHLSSSEYQATFCKNSSFISLTTWMEYQWMWSLSCVVNYSARAITLLRAVTACSSAPVLGQRFIPAWASRQPNDWHTWLTSSRF